MVHEDTLSGVLSEFARTMVTDFPIQAILDHLVNQIVEILPVSSAGVTLISEGSAPHYIAASDDAALRYERLQSDLGQGPCLSAFELGEAVAIPDLAKDSRFPRFAPAASAAGLAAVFTFPLRHGQGRLGALDLYRDTPGGLDGKDMTAAQTLADVATAYLLNAQARDVARRASDRYQHSALHDPLTGLPNRLLLQERLTHASQRAHRSRSTAAIFFADLDQFKLVNDTHGHAVGDQLLCAIAERLSALVRPGDTLARFSGDEFVFLCEDLHDTADADGLTRRIDQAFTEPFVLGGTELVVTASIGMAFAGPGEEISTSLLAQADLAMYHVKRSRAGSHQIVDLRDHLSTDDPSHLDQDLRTAFSRDDLDVAYQPIIRLADGQTTSVEALLRWNHPDRGEIPAASIVALAEAGGLIHQIGAWVLERACLERGQWLHQHPRSPVDITVNVSPSQLLSPDFVATVTTVLARTGMDPTALILEMTENILIEDSDHTRTLLADLKQTGIRLALDDFGTGHSSLSYLHRLPIDIIKIDQSFIADIDGETFGAAIVGAVTNLAHVLGLTVTAEGVETQAQHDQVKALGCEFAQGFFYHRALSGPAISSALTHAERTSPCRAAPRTRRG